MVLLHFCSSGFCNLKILIILDKLLFENLKLLNSAQISFLNEMPLRSNYMEKMSLASNLINLKTLNEDNLYIPVDIKVTNVNGENFDNLLNRIVMKNLPTKISQDVLIKGVSTRFRHIFQ